MFNLKKFRERANLTQTALANASGVDLSVINRLEHGIRGRRRSATWETVFRLSRALGTTPEKLWPIDLAAPTGWQRRVRQRQEQRIDRLERTANQLRQRIA